MVLVGTTIGPGALEGAPTLWYEADVASAPALLLFLDGELYRDRVGAEASVDRARADRTLGAHADARCAFVAHGGPEARHADFTCRSAYNRFLLEEVLPRLGRAPRTRRTVLVGLSLSGLAAAYAHLSHPDAFSCAVSQSPSAWWDDGWFARHLVDLAPSRARLYLSVERQETERDVRHPPTALHQATGQLDSVTHLAEVLPSEGASVSFSTFDGGHDPACWAAQLPAALAWAGA